MSKHYTDAYDRLIAAGGEDSPGRWRDRNASLKLHKTSGALLDLGCSSGAFLQSISGKGWDLYGIEISSESARVARARSGANIFVGDVLDAQFPNETFDVITCFDVFEHVYEPKKVMAKITDWLKPGGIFYVLVPNIDSAEGRLFGSYWHGLELPRHLFHYSPASLEVLAGLTGLRAVSVDTHRNLAVGTSLRYVVEDVIRAIGAKLTPVAYRKEANLAWRVIRKVARIVTLPVILATFPLTGGGESIHAIFQKPEQIHRSGGK
jgi:SAM-dependent methyltransferase